MFTSDAIDALVGKCESGEFDEQILFAGLQSAFGQLILRGEDLGKLKDYAETIHARMPESHKIASQAIVEGLEQTIKSQAGVAVE